MMGRRAQKPVEPLTPKRLRAKAFDLLARRDHSEKELEDKLLSRGGEAADVASLFQELRDIGLLDDHRFAQNFLSFRSGKAWGPRRYRQELMSRGISKEIVDEVLPEMEAIEPKLHRLVARELARGREPQKVMAAMIRRGFDYASVQEALRRGAASDDEEFWD